MIDLRTEFVPSFFVLGHICCVSLSIPGVLKQNIAEMTQDASQDKKTINNKPLLNIEYSVLGNGALGAILSMNNVLNIPHLFISSWMQPCSTSPFSRKSFTNLTGMRETLRRISTLKNRISAKYVIQEMINCLGRILYLFYTSLNNLNTHTILAKYN